MALASKRCFTARTRSRYYASSHLLSHKGLDAETLRGIQLAGELFLLTSSFIEPEGGEGS